MPTNSDMNGESSLAVELTAELIENMLQDLQRHYSLHLDKIDKVQVYKYLYQYQ